MFLRSGHYGVHLSIDFLNLFNYLECRERIWGYIKSRNLHIVKETVELGREQHYFGKSFVSTTFSQHHPTIQGYLLVLISITQSDKYIIIQDSKSCILIYNYILFDYGEVKHVLCIIKIHNLCMNNDEKVKYTHVLKKNAPKCALYFHFSFTCVCVFLQRD